jgi:hypothetical protein
MDVDRRAALRLVEIWPPYGLSSTPFSRRSGRIRYVMLTLGRPQYPRLANFAGRPGLTVGLNPGSHPRNHGGTPYVPGP